MLIHGWSFDRIRVRVIGQTTPVSQCKLTTLCCTSLTRPCLVDKETGDTTLNKHSWNNNASVIFLDQVWMLYIAWCDTCD